MRLLWHTAQEHLVFQPFLIEVLNLFLIETLNLSRRTKPKSESSHCKKAGAYPKQNDIKIISRAKKIEICRPFSSFVVWIEIWIVHQSRFSHTTYFNMAEPFEFIAPRVPYSLLCSWLPLPMSWFPFYAIKYLNITGEKLQTKRTWDAKSSEMDTDCCCIAEYWRAMLSSELLLPNPLEFVDWQKLTCQFGNSHKQNNVWERVLFLT